LQLIGYFEGPYYEMALERYEKEAKARRWALSDRLALYNKAKVSFGLPDAPVISSEPPAQNEKEEAAKQAFESLYDELRATWKVFRGSGDVWTAEQIYSALQTGCSACSRASGLHLMNLDTSVQDGNRASLRSALIRLAGLKQNATYPWMAASKFLHFFNPHLFPIFDQTVIWKEVLSGAFKRDYLLFCERRQIRVDEMSAQFNVNYTLLAAECLQAADAEFMDYFSAWYRRLAEGEDDPQAVLDDMSTYYAAAFEFVAMGAAALEQA
jgi:hypothetical protein